MSIMDGRIRLYLADIRPLYREEMQRRAQRLVDAERQSRADACKTARGRAASLAVGVLAEYALRQNGLGEYAIRYDAGGKPHVAEKRSGCRSIWGKEIAYLSLSHSGDYAVCAVASGPVGVDIQKVQPVRTGILRHFLDEKERLDFLGRYGLQKGEKYLPEDAADEFFRLWTAKESYMKLTGTGMAAGFVNLTADPVSGTVREKEKGAAIWKQYRAPEGYFLSVCLKI